jgi:hypothetical protein
VNGGTNIPCSKFHCVLKCHCSPGLYKCNSAGAAPLTKAFGNTNLAPVNGAVLNGRAQVSQTRSTTRSSASDGGRKHQFWVRSLAHLVLHPTGRYYMEASSRQRFFREGVGATFPVRIPFEYPRGRNQGDGKSEWKFRDIQSLDKPIFEHSNLHQRDIPG